MPAGTRGEPDKPPLLEEQPLSPHPRGLFVTAPGVAAADAKSNRVEGCERQSEPGMQAARAGGPSPAQGSARKRRAHPPA